MISRVPLDVNEESRKSRVPFSLGVKVLRLPERYKYSSLVWPLSMPYSTLTSALHKREQIVNSFARYCNDICYVLSSYGQRLRIRQGRCPLPMRNMRRDWTPSGNYRRLGWRSVLAAEEKRWCKRSHVWIPPSFGDYDVLPGLSLREEN